MDKLICKAKTIDHKSWIYGYFYKIWEDCYLLWGMTNEVPDMIKIDKDTLCRNTGLKDKNGDNIWENDLILYNELELPYIVKWNKEQAKYELQTKEGYSQAGFNEMTMKNCEIVGNIFDKK